MSTTVDLPAQGTNVRDVVMPQAEFERLRQDAAQWRELVRLLLPHGWLITRITPARIARDLPWVWPYGEFQEQK